MIIRLFIFSVLLLSSRGLLLAEPVKGLVKSVSGSAVLVTAQGHSEPITLTTPIPRGSKIHTGANSRVIIEWLPGAFSVVFPNSDVTVSSLDYSKPADGGAKRLVSLGIAKGSIFSHLVHNDGTSDFRIKTPEGVAAARGTDWFISCIGGVVKVEVLADAVTVTLPSGTVVNVLALFEYIMGDAAPSRLGELELQNILHELQAAGLTITMQDINDPKHTTLNGTATSGYIITFTPASGDGFQFFIPRWVGESDIDRIHSWNAAPGETPLPSNDFPKVRPASQ